MTTQSLRWLLVLSVLRLVGQFVFHNQATGGTLTGTYSVDVLGDSDDINSQGCTWQGTVTIQVNADVPDAPSTTSGSTTWTFDVVRQTNLQTFRATIHSENAWLPVDTIGTTALSPTNTPPSQISTQGDDRSPRGCQGTFGSFGTADATHIDADFKGADCNLVTFTGRVTLTKQ